VVGVAAATVAPKLGDGSTVDWWFAYKLNTASFPSCSGERKCIFGGSVQDYKYGFGLQYLLSSHVNGKTEPMTLHKDCLGSGNDPVAKTFAQIYGGDAPNYVIWNDQFYNEPSMTLDPPCSSWGKDANSCSAPWAHSKGAMAWDESGNGFIMQTSTPDWPGSGTSKKNRPTQGNTLGCIKDDNVEVAQHLFALKLTASDTKAVLTALRKASVVTDPKNSQLVKVTNSPSDLKSLVEGFGTLDKSTAPSQVTLSSGAKLIVKPQALNVAPWQMVSSMLKTSLRTATWWETPEIPSTHDGIKPGCWSSELGNPGEVQIATAGQWQGTPFGLTGGLGTNYNHAKLGHSLTGNLAIMGDMNQQGSLYPGVRSCSSSQNGRGGLFFVVDDATLHSGLKELMTGTTADYDDGPSPGPSPKPGPSPAPTPGKYDCGGPGSYSDCKAEAKVKKGCVYVHAADTKKCGVPDYGCYRTASLPSACPEKKSFSALNETVVLL
jgi:hypothetical protein